MELKKKKKSTGVLRAATPVPAPATRGDLQDMASLGVPQPTPMENATDFTPTGRFEYSTSWHSKRFVKVHSAKYVNQEALDGRVSHPWLSCVRCLSALKWC